MRSVLSRDRECSVLVRAGEATGERARLGVYDLIPGITTTFWTFYYRETLDASSIRESLARALAHYPPLTGRIERDPDGGLSLVCNDAGVMFAEVHGVRPMPCYDIRRTAKADLRTYVHRINVFKVVGHDTPLLAVKVTHMRGGGSVLGITIVHSIADGHSALGFLQHWSHEHLGLEYQAPPIRRDLFDGIDTPSGAEEYSDQYTVARRREMVRFLVRAGAGARRVRQLGVRFPADELRAMKEATAGPLDGTRRGVSTNDSLTAHLWKILSELRGRPGDSTEHLVLAVDSRSALRDKLPDGMWGNGATGATAALRADELRTAPLADVASAVRGALGGVTEGRMRREIAFLEAQRRAGNSRRVVARSLLNSFGDTVAVNSMGKLPMYRIDLGSGRPFWFEYPSSPLPWTAFIFPTPDDNGRDVYLSMPQDAARRIGTPFWEARLHAYAAAEPTGERDRLPES